MYVRDKGYGMGKYAEKITGLITAGEPEILTWRPREALPEMLGLPPW